MLVKNRWGRIVNVDENLARQMISYDGATLANEEPPETKYNPGVCPYCDFETNDEKVREIHIKECKKKAPLISIIIPSRVGEKIQSRKSLKEQTYKKIEIIVEYDEKGEGAPVVRNRGFKKAKGKFVLFSDNDLDWKSYAIEVLYKKLIVSKKAYSYGSYEMDGRIIGHREFSSHDLWKWNYISTMSLIRKKAFIETGGFDPKLKKFQDWDLWLNMLDKGKEGIFCGECLFKTEVRKGITYGKDAPDSITARKAVMKKYSHSDGKLADIIIPHQNRHDLLKICLDRLNHDLFNINVIVGGTFSENCNKGAKIAETDDLIFMNDDIEPEDEVIRQMLASKADIVGAAQITPSWHPEKIWYGIAYRWKNGMINEEITDNLNHVLIPTGFLFRIKKKVWDELKGFDESYKNGGEDQELFLTALEKGYTIDIIKIPTTHNHSSSRDRFKWTSDNRTQLNRRWTQERIKKLKDNLSDNQLIFKKDESKNI